MKTVTIVIRALMPDGITKDQLDRVAMDAAVQVEEPWLADLASAAQVESETFIGVGPFSVQRFRAKNDGNGNPRRVFVFRDGKGEIVRAVDEGYEGRGAVRAFERDHDCELVDLGDVTCTPTEYKELLRNHP